MTEKFNIGIVGGSLAGLMHGIVLKRNGHNVHILERTPASDMHDRGAGLGAGPNVQAFLEKYDLTKAPYAIDKIEYNTIDSNGTIIRSHDMHLSHTTWSVLYYRLRANFDGFQSNYCKPPAPFEGEGQAKYLAGCTVFDVCEIDGDIAVYYRDFSGAATSMNFHFLIAADGAGSTVRRTLLPDVESKYAYIAWRGTVPASEISPESKAAIVDGSTLCAIENSCALAYLMPGKNGSLATEDQVYNWVWYCLYPEGSEHHRRMMTDKSGREHRFSVPLGTMPPSTIERQNALARELLAPCVEELIRKTKNPYVQAITDMISPQAVLLIGKVLLVGDALVSVKPLTGLGVNQAARSAELLLDVLDGKIELKEWETNVLEYAKMAMDLGVQREAVFKIARKSRI